jgi:Polysulphide reductase, NrfD
MTASGESHREKRLDDIRDTALQRGEITGPSVRAQGGPIPHRPGYHGEAVVRPPVWTWEIPIYLFIGGLGGMSPTIACAALVSHQAELARMAMLLAAVAAIVSPILLILDLGRPSRFINMLRVFKHQSAMSVGVWILTVFSPCAVGGFLALEFNISLFAWLFVFAAAFFGLGLATYTGVLLGATAIPVWNLHHRLLPMHFGAAGLGSAAAVLELLGHRIRQLNALGIAVAALETAFWIWLELHRHGKADRAAHEGGSGWGIRLAELFTGPTSLVLRLLGAVPLAAISFVLGALISRFAWMAAGRASGRDPEAVFAAQSAH